jgi:hypothetical protein
MNNNDSYSAAATSNERSIAVLEYILFGRLNRLVSASDKASV